MDNSQQNPSTDSNNLTPPVLPPTPPTNSAMDNASFSLPPLPETPTPVEAVASSPTPPATPASELFPTLSNENQPEVTPPAQPAALPPLPPLPETQATTPSPEPILQAPQEPAVTSELPITDMTQETPPLPSKPKTGKKFVALAGSVIAVFLVAGIAASAYFITQRASTKVAVAPTAPTSVPFAAESCPSVPNLAGPGEAGSGCVTENCGFADCKRDGITYDYKCGSLCFQNSCGAAACSASPNVTYETCTPERRDLPYGTETNHVWNQPVTFATAGKVLPFMRNGDYTGTITLTKSGSPTLTIPFSGAGTKELAPITVVAGDYNMKVTIVGDQNRDSIGWIRNKSANTCGPVKTPGAAIDANSKPTGKCGDEADISALVTLANSKATLTGITANGGSASIQCWGDAYQGDDTTDWDFNDFSLAFGYEKPAETTTKTYGPVCIEVNKTAMNSGVWPTTSANFKAPVMNEDVRLYAMANESQNVKFTVKLDGVVILDKVQGLVSSPAPTSGTTTYNYYYQFKIDRPGVYTYEAIAL